MSCAPPGIMQPAGPHLPWRDLRWRGGRGGTHSPNSSHQGQRRTEPPATRLQQRPSAVLDVAQPQVQAVDADGPPTTTSHHEWFLPTELVQSMPCFYHYHYDGRTRGSIRDRERNTTLCISSLPEEMPEHELIATLLMGRARRTLKDEGRYLWSWGNTQVVARNFMGKYPDTPIPAFLGSGNAFLKFYDR